MMDLRVSMQRCDTALVAAQAPGVEHGLSGLGPPSERRVALGSYRTRPSGRQVPGFGWYRTGRSPAPPRLPAR